MDYETSLRPRTAKIVAEHGDDAAVIDQNGNAYTLGAYMQWAELCPVPEAERDDVADEKHIATMLWNGRSLLSGYVHLVQESPTE
ncbi:MAG: hypothetical protein JWN82_85 [Candidatus Saccharibacteria bacterium]|nr:hypothetical protein [Candidatus Saccharibacteria bacterium]